MYSLLNKSLTALICVLFTFFTLLPAQTVVKRLNACIDDTKTISIVDFPCANASSTLSLINVVAFKRLINKDLQLQFSEIGEATISCNCPNGTTEIIKITVTDCDTLKCAGPNLVLNGGFETYANCNSNVAPNRNLSLTNVVLPWYDFTNTTNPGSSDYYNPLCPYTTVNAFGLPFLNANRARTGNGFIGQYCALAPPFLKEYSAIPLSRPLSIGKKYRARFYTKVSPPTNTTFMKTDRIGMSLTRQSPRSLIKTTATPFGNTNDYVGNTPVVQSPIGTPVGDTTFWTRYEAIFTADSAYTTLVLGGLAKYSETQTFGNSAVAYYLFDDISLNELNEGIDTTRLPNALSCAAKDTGLVIKRLKNRFGCDSLVYQKIGLKPNIFLNIGSDTTVINGTNLTLKASVTGDSLAAIIWTPPTGLTCTNCLSPQLVAQNNTLYIATAVGRNGCQATDSFRLTVKNQDFVFVPNVFSPNGDGANDVLTVYASANRVKSIVRFAVFNRWGDQVFERRNFAPNDEKDAWTGNKAGNDVFVYFVEFELFDGQRLVVSGDTSITR